LGVGETTLQILSACIKTAWEEGYKMQRDAHLMCLHDIQSVLQHYNYSNGFAANLGSSGASKRTPSPSGSSREAAFLRERGSGPEASLEDRLELIRFYQEIFERCMQDLREFTMDGSRKRRKEALHEILDKIRECYQMLEEEIDNLLLYHGLDNAAKNNAIEELPKILPSWTLEETEVPGWTKVGWEEGKTIAGRWEHHFEVLFHLMIRKILAKESVHLA